MIGRATALGGLCVAAAMTAQAWAADAPNQPASSVETPYGLHAPDLVAPLSLEALVRAASTATGEIDLHNISYSVDGEVQTVPLPAAAPVLLAALAALGLLARRWKVS